MKNAIAVVGLLSLAGGSVWAGAQGAAFRASSCPSCRQGTPAIAGSASGAFLIAWEGQSAADLRGISGRLFTGIGSPQTADFLVAKDVAPDQYDPAVTRDSRGIYIAAWSVLAAGNSEIMVQRLRPKGAPLGAAFKANQDATGLSTIPFDFNPAVAPSSDGGFVVVWLSLLPAGGDTPGISPQVLARRFSAAGAPLGPQIQLNRGLVNDERPEVCVDTAGGIIAVWTSVDQFIPFQPSKLGISMRRLSPAGVPLAPEEVILPPAANHLQSALSCGRGKTFVVVWHSDLPPAQEGTDVLGQRFSRLGRKVGPIFRINSAAASQERNPAISHDAKGNFVVVWEANSETTMGIFGRRFSAAAMATGPEFEVFTDPHSRPSAARVAHVGTAGNFVVVWQDAARTSFGRRFTP